MAFPLAQYRALLANLLERSYSLLPVRAYFEEYSKPTVFLRHDVDRFPGRAVRMARMERELDVRATYYFRSSAGGQFPEAAIRKVAALGHEIGYHYEVVTRHGADSAEALEAFARDVSALRELADVKTVAAHGSPLSGTSNIGYAQGLDRAALGLLGEPQTDFDFSRVIYITDTGGIFGSPHNRRDWSPGKNLREPMTPEALARWLHPEREPLVLLTTHPERWPESRAAANVHAVLDWGVNVMKRLRNHS
ncbi:MAG: hypothetical protein ACOX5J_10485 [Candidatus Hydrogenedentales bacterium]